MGAACKNCNTPEEGNLTFDPDRNAPGYSDLNG
mgnify:CR=1 FL=1